MDRGLLIPGAWRTCCSRGQSVDAGAKHLKCGIGFGHVSTATFIVYTAILGVVLGAIVTSPIALCAMADEPNRP
jgi:hypothetical protein